VGRGGTESRRSGIVCWVKSRILGLGEKKRGIEPSMSSFTEAGGHKNNGMVFGPTTGEKQIRRRRKGDSALEERKGKLEAALQKLLLRKNNAGQLL